MSKEHLIRIAPEATIEILPDTAFSLSTLWPLNQESDEFIDWRNRLRVRGRYVVLQASLVVSNHYEPIQALINSMIAVTAVVLPICLCHGDSRASSITGNPKTWLYGQPDDLERLLSQWRRTKPVPSLQEFEP